MHTLIKKMIRFALYSILLSSIGLLGFLVSRKKGEYRIILNPSDNTKDLLGGIHTASAESSDTGDSSSDSGSGSSSDM